MKLGPSVVTLIGDVVDSREAIDRPRLHRELTEALTAADDLIPSRRGLEVTVGDEFQAVYAALGPALDVALRLRLALLPGTDVRFGIGRGSVVDLDLARGLQDGPGWWAAREALDHVEQSARGSALRTWRTAYRSAEAAPADEAVNAALLCQDQLVGSLSDRARRLLKGLLNGATQAQLAQAEGVSRSAVSQQVRSQGIGAILHAHDLMRRLP